MHPLDTPTASSDWALHHESRTARRPRVLVVAMPAARRRWVEGELEEHGHDVEVVEPGSRALVGRARAVEAAVVFGDASTRWLTAVRALRAASCASVLVLRDADASAVDRAIVAGVPEILIGPITGPELDRAVRSAAGITARWREALESMGLRDVGSDTIPHFDLDGCLDRLGRRGELTRRERDVLRAMLCGRRIEEIARELHISDNTVKFHVRNVLRKLELRSRSELLRLLVE